MRNSNAVRSAVKEFSFKNSSREFDSHKLYDKFTSKDLQNSTRKSDLSRTSNIESSNKK